MSHPNCTNAILIERMTKSRKFSWNRISCLVTLKADILGLPKSGYTHSYGCIGWESGKIEVH